jgi:hypothetical protein
MRIQSRRCGHGLLREHTPYSPAVRDGSLPANHTTTLPATLPKPHHPSSHLDSTHTTPITPNLYNPKTSMPPQPKKKQPWWCSGQHTRPGILSSYPLLPKNLIFSLLEGREVASSNLAHGISFCSCVLFSVVV